LSNESEGILLFGSELNKEKITKNTEHKEWRAIVSHAVTADSMLPEVSREWRLLYFRKQVLHF